MPTETEANRRLVQAIFAGLETGNGALFAVALADDVVMRVTGNYSGSRTFTGKEAVMRDLYGYVRSLVKPGHDDLGEANVRQRVLPHLPACGRQDCRDAGILRLGAL